MSPAMRGPLLGLLIAMTLGACATRSLPPDAPAHHTASGFRNLPGSPARDAGPWTFTKFFWQMLTAGDEIKNPPVPAGHVLPREQVAREVAALVASGADGLTWLGHAAFLIRLGGKTILTDPYLSPYASPLPGFGPKRFVPSAVPVDELPPLDLVLISHNHYDHLDEETLRALPGKERLTVIVPLKLGAKLRALGFANVVELDWDGSHASGPVSVTLVPAIHFSARGLFDRDDTLWGGFAIAAGGRKLFFSGDTGYHPTAFRDIGRRHGPFDMGLIGIGAYEPRSIMVATHATPEEALSIGLDTGSKAVVGMHWGTVALTPEPPFEPPARLAAAARGTPLEGRAGVMAIGETRWLGDNRR